MNIGQLGWNYVEMNEPFSVFGMEWWVSLEDIKDFLPLAIIERAMDEGNIKGVMHNDSLLLYKPQVRVVCQINGFPVNNILDIPLDASDD